jgi:beta-galactosidase
MGGGMAVAYHRRPLLTADDTAAMEVVKLGSGVVGYGYYMFHGGTNPDGFKTTLQESQATGYPNDLPVKSYDFQAPLGEFGQFHDSYRVLKTLHLFLNDFGTSLAPMTAYFPDHLPVNKEDVATPRVAARIEKDRGFIFINNHERANQMPEKRDFQVQIKFAPRTLQVPRDPTNIPADAYTIWPFNLDLGSVVLRYSTAQLLCRLDEPRTYVFFAWPGITPEFAFDDKDGISIEASSGRVRHDQNVTFVEGITPGTNIAIHVKARNGKDINVLVLRRKQALDLSKLIVTGKQRLVLSPAHVYQGPNGLHLATSDPSLQAAAFFPALKHTPAGFTRGDKNGIFERYAAPVISVTAKVELKKIQEAGDDPPVRMGKEVALAPEDHDFDNAARWEIAVSPFPPRSAARLFLQIAYEGDVARLYVNHKLVTDNFYNGTPWLISLDRIPAADWSKLEVKILPLGKDSPLYLPKGAWPSFSPENQVGQINSVQAVAEYDTVLKAKP